MGLIRSFQATMPAFVRTLLEHRPPSLRGRPLGQTVRVPDRTPRRLAAYYRSFTESRDAMRRASPSLVFAALGQARANGLISPEKEASILGEQITYWAMKSTLEGLMTPIQQPGSPGRRATTALSSRPANVATRLSV